MAASAPKTTAAVRKPKSATDRQFVTALARGMSVLRCFDALHTQLGTTEIAHMTKLPQPTVWRLCYTLQQLGYLVQAPDSDKLRIGMSVLGLGQYALNSTDIGEMILPEMMQLAKQTGAAVSLGIVDQDDILIVKRAQGDGHLLFNLSVGDCHHISRLGIPCGLAVTNTRGDPAEAQISSWQQMDGFTHSRRSSRDQYGDQRLCVQRGSLPSRRQRSGCCVFRQTGQTTVCSVVRRPQSETKVAS